MSNNHYNNEMFIDLVNAMRKEDVRRHVEAALAAAGITFAEGLNSHSFHHFVDVCLSGVGEDEAKVNRYNAVRAIAAYATKTNNQVLDGLVSIGDGDMSSAYNEGINQK